MGANLNPFRNGCPHCGKKYKHPSMALRCLRTPKCRMFNAASGERRELAEIQFKLSVCVQFSAMPLAVESDDKDIKGYASGIIRLVEELYADMRALHIGLSIFNAVAEPMTRKLEKIWIPHVRIDVVHMLAVIMNLVADGKYLLRDRFERQGQYMADNIWTAIEAGYEAIFDLMNPENDENYPHIEKVTQIYDDLYAYIFPAEKERKLKAYVLGNRFWAIANSKSEAKDLLRKELGIVGLTAVCQPLDAKLETGITVREFIEQIGKIGIVARNGD